MFSYSVFDVDFCLANICVLILMLLACLIAVPIRRLIKLLLKE